MFTGKFTNRKLNNAAPTMIPKDVADKIKTVSKLEDVIPNLRKSGKDLYIKCPKCGKLDTKKKKGLMVNTTKQIAKCFSCDWGTNNAVTYLMDTEALNYPDALIHLAEMYYIDIEEDQNRQERLHYEEKEIKRQRRKNKKIQTFCDKQMKESGLEPIDTEVNGNKYNGTCFII
jgi:DNA primase